MSDQKSMDTEQYRLMSEVCECASDYVLAFRNDEFANTFGGIDKLRKDLEESVSNYEMWDGWSND